MRKIVAVACVAFAGAACAAVMAWTLFVWSWCTRDRDV